MKRHALDPLSLVFGLLFTVLALTFLGGNRSVAELGVARLWPIPIIAIGMLVFLYGAKRMFRRDPEHDPDVDNETGATP